MPVSIAIIIIFFTFFAGCILWYTQQLRTRNSTPHQKTMYSHSQSSMHPPSPPSPPSPPMPPPPPPSETNETTEAPTEIRTHRNQTLRSEAKAVEHKLYHLPKNPCCEACIRGKMKEKPSRRGAFKRESKNWENF